MTKNTIKKMAENLSKRSIYTILGVGIFILLIIGLIKFGSIFAFLWVFPWVSREIAFATGINVWLARGIGVVVAIFIVYAISQTLSLSRTKRLRGIVMFGAGIIFYSVAMFVITQNHNFDASGTAVRCYADTPYGIKYVSCGWKVHPIYGTAVHRISSEIAISEGTQKNGIPNIERVTPSRNMRFFTADGSPLVWYYQHLNGKLEFFSRPGRHPQFNVVLNPISPAIVQQLFKFIEQDRGEMIVVRDSGASDELYTGTASSLNELRSFLLTIKPK